MYENKFNRVEQKYLITKEQYQNLFNKIDEHIEKDKYYNSKICNIYFDNEQEEIINRSIEKPPFKQKIRLRSYKIPSLDDNVFLETKTKYKHIVTKRRIKVKLKDFNNYLETGKYNEQSQIMKEIAYLFSYYNLKPFYFVAYDRKSYYCKEDKNLRITVDGNLRSRKDNLSLNKGDNGKKYFSTDTYIMEIKYLNGLPLWLVRSLSELKIYPVSFSKLGSIYMKEMEEKMC